MCVYTVCVCVCTLSRPGNAPRSLAGASTLSIKSPAGQNNSRGGRVAQGWGKGGEWRSGDVGNPKAERGQWASLAFPSWCFLDFYSAAMTLCVLPYTLHLGLKSALAKCRQNVSLADKSMVSPATLAGNFLHCFFKLFFYLNASVILVFGLRAPGPVLKLSPFWPLLQPLIVIQSNKAKLWLCIKKALDWLPLLLAGNKVILSCFFTAWIVNWPYTW